MTPPPRKRLSFSTGAGAGYARADGDLIDFSGPPLVIGDFGFGVFLSESVELQLWLPILSIITLAAVSHRPEFWGDLFLKVRPLGERSGLFVAPGLGVWYLSGHPLDGVDPGPAKIYELPVRLGYEWTTRRPWLAVSIAARPWVSVIDFADTIRIGGGVMAELGIHFYIIR